jgi:hypothetical protein
MDMIEIEGGEVLANLEDRTITGLLVPYGELGRTNVGQFEVEAGVIKLPSDPVVVGINLDHDRFSPIGRATRVWEEERGIFASFAIANTPEGDAALADARDPNGKRRCLSGEFRTGIKAGKATGGHLAGAALVERGAFPSAGVLAADTEETHITEYVDENGNKWRRVEESTVSTEPTAGGGTETTIHTTTTITDEPASEEPASDDDTDPEETEVSASAIPVTQRPGAPAATTTERPVDLRPVFAAFAEVKANPSAESAAGVLAALNDIKISGTGSLPTGGDVIQPNWLGQLYQGIPYVREYITLGKLGTDISAGGKKGYKVRRGTSSTPVDHFDGTWSGNKTAIPSGGGFTESAASELFRFAFGNDIAREFFDLPGGAEVVEAFFKLVIEDHLVWSDLIALQTWVSVAGTPIAPKTYPGVDGHDYGNALGQLIQGILAVKAKKADGRRDVPTFAIANEAAFEQLIYTPKDLIPEFVSFTASTDGTGSADGIRLVQGDTGIENTPSVIVGAGSAVEFDELPGGPLHINALDLARGGVDRAIHGYLQRFVVRPEAVVHIGVADTAGA